LANCKRRRNKIISDRYMFSEKSKQKFYDGLIKNEYIWKQMEVRLIFTILKIKSVLQRSKGITTIL
jgi:hypothetical protein